MIKRMMDVSIIIPVYNAEKTLRKCILSLLNSEFNRKLEIIVVDDGSTDNSMATISDLDVRRFSQENKGAATARNHGARNAKSNIIIFVDSDVIFFKDTLQKIYLRMIDKSNGKLALLIVRYSRRSVNTGIVARYKALADYFYSYVALYCKEQRKGLIDGAILPGGCEAYDKRIFWQLGGFDESIKGADVEREAMYHLCLKLDSPYLIVADGHILTMHHFPDFKGVAKAYFHRTMNTMGLVHKRGYRPHYLKSNSYRVASGALVIPFLVLSIILFISNPLLAFLFVIPLYCYLYIHIPLFKVAVKEYGFSFLGYTLVLNIVFCTIICSAGALGTLKHKVLSK
jgi:glycosyltransferase involved in cell wall biosynthesis